MNTVEIINCKVEFKTLDLKGKLQSEGFKQFAISDNSDEMEWLDLAQIYVQPSHHKDTQDKMLIFMDDRGNQVFLHKQNLMYVVVFMWITVIYFFDEDTKRMQTLTLRK